MFTILIPALAGGYIIYFWDRTDNTASSIVVGVIIFFISGILNSIIIGIYNESLSSVFILYCLD
jgi:drug/metabolite transporter superfamily protein YnfA